MKFHGVFYHENFHGIFMVFMHAWYVYVMIRLELLPLSNRFSGFSLKLIKQAAPI
jgi:hypothetical protein